ncbi:cytochrome bd biosynthesis protein [[Haemophilus] ducreyi]|uniref:cyd operon protein YbgE n=1 Tax=Haemophilus ducreyi TaxID=730 RepID=UPI000656680B|nr:cyd operon protein YbgE [[Haemophilus] ducreyi]AKO40190.1 cytochrome bd biosynthesis protein [[Haemophilus] ducreyi]
MIHSIYNLTRKGWLKALSFILALLLFIVILLNPQVFASYFGGHVPYLAIFVFYGMAILWIHGIGLDIHRTFWQLLFWRCV